MKFFNSNSPLGPYQRVNAQMTGAISFLPAPRRQQKNLIEIMIDVGAESRAPENIDKKKKWR